MKLFYFYLLLLSYSCFAEKKIKAKISGQIKTGLAYEYTGSMSTTGYASVYTKEAIKIGEGQLELNIKAGKGIKGKFELEADLNSAGVRIDRVISNPK